MTRKRIYDPRFPIALLFEINRDIAMPCSRYLKKTFRKYMLLLGLPFFMITCKKTYAPPAVTINYNYLAVDGFINTGANGITTISLSRTRTLSDTANIPEPNAQVTIVSSNGNSYSLQAVGATGNYNSIPLNLDTNETYQLAITTADGVQYASDFVRAKLTPPIDTLTWQQQDGVTIYLNTHDPNNNTHYYKWDYTETWQYHSTLQNYLGVKDGLIYYEDSSNQTYLCWYSGNSTDILLGSSVALGEDKISQAPIASIPNDDVKINFRYSILVRQYALTADAYNYWFTIQKTSQQLGSLFDVQPTQLNGNFHCVTNANIPVIGFVSASSVQQQRIFISNDQLSNWPYNKSLEYSCPLVNIPVNPVNFAIYTYSDTSYAPYYFLPNSGPLVLTKKVCIDCTLTGGVSETPSFW